MKNHILFRIIVIILCTILSSLALAAIIFKGFDLFSLLGIILGTMSIFGASWSILDEFEDDEDFID